MTMVMLSDNDLEQHMDGLEVLPKTDDLGEHPMDDNYYHDMLCRFYETFCPDSVREKKFLEGGNSED